MELSSTRLWCWDTGGAGEPIILVHPATGSGLIWEYQQPFFVEAGYRVIGYSRRGYYGSAAVDGEDPGFGSEDLHELVECLGIDELHLVGSAAGGGFAVDYAISHPERLLSLVISGSSAGVRSGPIAEVAKRIRPQEQWRGLPHWFRELGPSYRAGNPEGTKRWIDLEHRSLVGDANFQKLANQMTAELLGELSTPTLLMSGDSDFTTPPELLRMVASHIEGSEVVAVPEAGHSLYWERPDVFNPTVLDFIQRHPAT